MIAEFLPLHIDVIIGLNFPQFFNLEGLVKVLMLILESNYWAEMLEDFLVQFLQGQISINQDNSGRDRDLFSFLYLVLCIVFLVDDHNLLANWDIKFWVNIHIGLNFYNLLIFFKIFDAL